MSTWSVIAASLVAILGSFGAVVAEPGPGALGHGRFIPLRHALSRLDLTPEQKTSIREILENERATLAPLKDAAIQARRALAEAADAPTFDDGSVRAAAERVAKVRVDLAVGRARSLARVRAVLTPEQARRLEDARVAIRERSERRQWMRQQLWRECAGDFLN